MAKLQGKLSDINMVIFNGQECKLVHFDDACTWADKYSLTIPQLPVGVGSCEVTRVSSQATLATKGKIAVGSATSETKVDIYYSDVLSATATEGRGFNAPTVTLSETNVTNNVTANIERGSPKATTLSWSAKPTGVASFSLVALRSPYEGWVSESDPINLSADGKAGSQTVYFGDEFGVEATAETGYGTPKLNVDSSFTVDLSPISITVEAGATKEYQMTLPAFGPTIKSVTVKKNGTTVATGKQYEIVYFKANHFDTLTLEVVSAEGYEASTYKSSWYITGPTSFEWSEPNVKQYTLKKVVSGNGVKDYVVKRTDSPLGLATTGELSDGATVFYGDVLTQSANPVTGYYTPGFNWTNKTITVNDSTANSNKEITSTVTGGGVIKSKLIINALSTGVASLKVERTYSQLQGAGRGELTNGADIYYGDTLKGTATASTGYNDPTVNIGSAYSVTDKNVTVEATAGSLKTYTLSLVGYNATISVTKNSRPLNNGATITHFDKLIVSATAEAGYRITSITAGGVTITSGTEVEVTGNLTVTVNTEAIPYTLSYPAQPTGGTFTILKSAGDGSGNMTPIQLNTSGGSFTVYKNETYVVETSPADSRYWNAPTTNWSGNEITVGTDNVTLTVTHQPKAFTLTMPVCPSPGVSSYTITRSGTYKTADWTSAGGNSSVQTKTVYYGDKLSISAVAQSGFANPTATVASSVSGNLSATVTRGLKMATLTINKCNQANTHIVKRNGTSIASGTTVYEGEVLSYEVSAKTGYYTPTHKWTSTTTTSSTASTYTVTVSDSTITSTSFDAGVKSYLLSITQLGCAVTVKRGNDTLSNGATIYHFDTLTISAAANTGYKTPTIYVNTSKFTSGSTYTVSGNVTISAESEPNGYVLSWPAKPAGAKFTLLKEVTTTSQEIIVQNPGSAGSTVLPYGTSVFVDYEAENSTYWNSPTVSWNSKIITGDTNFIIYHSPKSCKLTCPATPSGVASYTISRDFTYSSYAGTGVIKPASTTGADSITVYYGDKLTISATAASGYTAPTASLSQTTVTNLNGVTATVTRGYAIYKLTISTASQAATHTVTRTSSKVASTGALSNGATIYEGDTLTAGVTAKTGYKTPSIDWTSKTVSGNVTSTTTNNGALSYTLTKGSTPTGVSTFTVSRTSSPYQGAGTGALSNGATIYYGDKLTASATATTGYNDPTVSWSSLTVDGNESCTVTAGSVKSYTLTISVASQAKSHTVSRTSSPLKGASTGTLSSGATIYYGDTLTASVTEGDAYNKPSLNWTSATVSGNLTSTSTNTGVKSYTLTISAKPTGVATHTVTRTSSPYQGASTGNLSSGATIFYGDTLTQTATAATDYLAPSVNWSSRTVSSSVTATATSGPYAYVTLYYYACPTGGRYEIFSVNTSTGNTTPIVTNPTSNGSVRLNYGTYLRAAYSVTDSTVYQVYGAAWSELQATSDVEFGINVDVKNWTLSKSSNYGVSSHTVSRTSSPYKGASTGSLSDGATIYYGDKLSQSASALSGYSVSVNWDNTTVTGKVTATATATKQAAKVEFGLDTPYAVYSVTEGTTWGSWTSADGNPYGQMYHHISDMVAPAEAAANAGIFILHPNGYPVFWNETIKAELYITGTPQD